MNPRFDDRSRADHDAAKWAIRLEEGPLSSAERAALKRWLARHPEHLARLNGYTHFCADIDAQLMALSPAQLAAYAPDVQPVTQNRHGWRAAAGLAAAAAIALGAWLAFAGRPPSETITTPPAHRQSIALADGTRADLNARTTLKVDFSDRRRRLVTMEQGEALFTVSKDPSRPFIVDTPGGKVRVTGTVFNVRTAASGRLEVTVLEGSVEVVPAAGAAKVAVEPLHLTGGDQVALDREGSLTMTRGQREAAAESVSWREGRVTFNGVPLAQALERFAAFHGRTILVSPEVADLRVGGRYSLDDLDGFLAAISSAMPILIHREADGSVRVTAP